MNKIANQIMKISLLSLVFVVSFSCKPDPVVEPEDLNGNLSGTVIDKDGQTPIESAEVILVGIDTALTDSEGMFLFSDLPSKSYDLRANSAAYLPGNDQGAIVIGGETKNIVLELELGAKPGVSTQAVVNINMTFAEVNGRIVSIGDDSEIASYGHCWATNSLPTILNFNSDNGFTNLLSPFSTKLEDLLPGTKYYLRAYAKNIYGVAYSAQIEFTTEPGEPAVTTNPAMNIEFNQAEISSNLTSFGLSSVTQHGHVWSKTPLPTISNFKTELGEKADLGYFKSTVTKLEMEATYYIRAYATNATGTAYSEEQVFTTTNSFIDKRDGKTYEIVKIGDQIWMKENLQYEASNSICYQFSKGCSVYGRLYDWTISLITTTAPAGWHLPSEAEYNTLITYLGGESVAGGKMKAENPGGYVSEYWQAPNLGATDESGFTALGGGYFNDTNNPLEHFTATMFWTSTAPNASEANCVRLDTDVASVSITNKSKAYFLSVRCVLD